MKAIIFAFFLCVTVVSAAKSLKCDHSNPDIKDFSNFNNMTKACTDATRQQVEAELKASMEYLAMGSYFLKDSVNRPGFAKLFMHSATEEREHAIKLINYLLMRGELTKDASTLINFPYRPSTRTWDDGLGALKAALALEVQVTGKIRNLVAICEAEGDDNDYHFVDYLTGEFLEEQYKGERELAGRISTLNRMNSQHGSLAEFLYDKKLLE